MLAPLMRPEGLVVPVDINPVLIHVGEEVVTALRLQDIRDIGVSAGRVTACLVGAVAVVGPGFVNMDIHEYGAWPLPCVTYHRPWTVHEVEGPVDGLVSQNWVCKRAPPG